MLTESHVQEWAVRLDRVERCVLLISEDSTDLPKLVQTVERVSAKSIVVVGVEDVHRLDTSNVNLPLIAVPPALQKTKAKAQATRGATISIWLTFLCTGDDSPPQLLSQLH